MYILKEFFLLFLFLYLFKFNNLSSDENSNTIIKFYKKLNPNLKEYYKDNLRKYLDFKDIIYKNSFQFFLEKLQKQKMDYTNYILKEFSYDYNNIIYDNFFICNFKYFYDFININDYINKSIDQIIYSLKIKMPIKKIEINKYYFYIRFLNEFVDKNIILLNLKYTNLNDFYKKFLLKYKNELINKYLKSNNCLIFNKKILLIYNKEISVFNNMIIKEHSFKIKDVKISYKIVFANLIGSEINEQILLLRLIDYRELYKFILIRYLQRYNYSLDSKIFDIDYNEYVLLFFISLGYNLSIKKYDEDKINLFMGFQIDKYEEFNLSFPQMGIIKCSQQSVGTKIKGLRAKENMFLNLNN